MPVGRRTAAGEVRAIVMVVMALVVLVGGVLLFLNLVSNRSGDVTIRLGDERFDAGRVDRIAAEIDDRGPILYSDVAGGTRDMLLNHLSEDPQSGWVAFEARRPGAERDCALRWDPDRQVFAESSACGGATFPPDGSGLQQYPVEVIDGNIVVDLNAEARATTTTRPGATTSSSVVVSGR